MDVVALLATLVVVIVLGCGCIWVFDRWRQGNVGLTETEWRTIFEPAGENLVGEPLPDDYRDWAGRLDRITPTVQGGTADPLPDPPRNITQTGDTNHGS